MRFLSKFPFPRFFLVLLPEKMRIFVVVNSVLPLSSPDVRRVRPVCTTEFSFPSFFINLSFTNRFFLGKSLRIWWSHLVVEFSAPHDFPPDFFPHISLFCSPLQRSLSCRTFSLCQPWHGRLILEDDCHAPSRESSLSPPFSH